VHVRPTAGLSTRLIAIGVAPFVGGFILSRCKPAAPIVGLIPCPVHAITGVPCPACGGTRTFTALAEGGSPWRAGNTPLVLYAALLTLVGVVLRASPKRRRKAAEECVSGALQEMRCRPGLTVAIALLVALPPWIAALRMDGGRSGAGDGHSPRADETRC
jgi:hypothetical protein